MTPEERIINHKQQTESLYAGLGEFVVSFEMLVHAMRHSLVMLLSQGKLHGQSLAQPAFAEMTAAPLRSTYLASFSADIKHCNLDEIEKTLGQKILQNVCKRIQDITSVRNELVHGTWFIGWSSADTEQDIDYSKGFGFKPKNCTTGTTHKIISRTREEFDALSDKCLILAELADRILLLMMIGNATSFKFAFSNSFIFLNEEVCVKPSCRKVYPRAKTSTN